MTQEQKELLLKDLCARLPYGVKCKDDTLDFTGIMTDISMHDNMCKLYNDYGDNYTCYMMNCKPFLFPMSSMTEEQEKDIFHNGEFYFDHHNSLCRFSRYEDDCDFVTMEDCLEIFNKLNKYHLDYRGLIPMGLANDATVINIY